MKCSKLVMAAVATAVLGMASGAVMAGDDDKMMKGKCYGVAKAGMNDCGTKSTSCAGTSTMDGEGDAFIVMPKKLCERLSGSSFGNPS